MRGARQGPGLVSKHGQHEHFEPYMSDHSEQPTRRDFLYVATGTFSVIGATFTAWPLVDQMNPDRSVLALASTEVDLAGIDAGQGITVKWRGKPVFIRHRTAREIQRAQLTKLEVLPDPQSDADRVKRPEWLVMIGICTHLGCVPLGQRGEFDGWFCPCHGSHYDTSGRIRKGPAPANLAIPPYEFLSETKIKIG